VEGCVKNCAATTSSLDDASQHRGFHGRARELQMGFQKGSEDNTTLGPIHIISSHHMLRKGFTNNHFQFSSRMSDATDCFSSPKVVHFTLASLLQSELAMERLKASIAKDFQDHDNKNSQRFETLTVKIDQLGDKVGVSFDKAASSVDNHHFFENCFDMPYNLSNYYSMIVSTVELIAQKQQTDQHVGCF
jgi:hypothetical protein